MFMAPFDAYLITTAEAQRGRTNKWLIWPQVCSSLENRVTRWCYGYWIPRGILPMQNYLDVDKEQEPTCPACVL